MYKKLLEMYYLFLFMKVCHGNTVLVLLKLFNFFSIFFSFLYSFEADALASHGHMIVMQTFL